MDPERFVFLDDGRQHEHDAPLRLGPQERAPGRRHALGTLVDDDVQRESRSTGDFAGISSRETEKPKLFRAPASVQLSSLDGLQVGSDLQLNSSPTSFRGK